MQRDFGCLIFVALPSTRLRSAAGLFAAKYTVRCTQEYEVQFARVGHTMPQSVFRRYRQFHQLHRAVAALGYAEQLEVRFPAKQALSNLKAEVVSYRRAMLEQWLRQVAGVVACHAFVYEFLGITGSVTLQTASTGAGESQLTFTLHRLLSEPQMKLSILEDFERRFFPYPKELHGDYLAVFVQYLLPLLADTYAGIRGLIVLRKLLSRSQFRSAPDVLSLLSSLDAALLSQAKLETHILSGREEACEVFQLLYEERVAQGPAAVLTVVSSTQVNGSSAAVQSFEAWRRRQSEQEALSPALTASPWRVQTDGTDVRSQLRAVGKGIECEALILISASMDRIVDVFMNPDLRALWDARFLRASIAPTDSPQLFLFEVQVDHSGTVQAFPGVLSVIQESDSKTSIAFNAHNGELRTSYEITRLRRSSMLETSLLPLSSQTLPHFAEESAEDWSTPRFQDAVGEPECEQCQVVAKNYGGEVFAKAFVQDLLGERQAFLDSWRNFKAVSEGRSTLLAEDTEGLSEALDRKGFLRSSRHRSQTTGSLQQHKLERRMLQS